MTTRQEIERQIQNDIDNYNNKIYDGFLPENFIEKFKQALMAVPIGTHQYSLEAIKKIISKRESEVNIVEVGMIINLLFMTPPNKIYDSLDQFINEMTEFNKVSVEYNRQNKEFEKTIIRKKDRLLKLSGIVDAVPYSQNGMQIIGK
jgi:hypothetical protein